MLEKNYDISSIEKSIYAKWLATACFKAGEYCSPDAETFSMMLPPPNLTGSLHMGHALNNTIQDIIARFMRMNGKNVLWQPGLDHAGIAAQMVVERHLASTGRPTRQELGREEFLKEIWAWCEQYGGVITEQMRRLGSSCDWSRERFTMDDGLSASVLEVFVRLYKQGLIYKDKRLVNWDPSLHTAISDIEVEQKEVKGSLWYIRYALADKIFNADDESTFITVATTRPETIFGDSALAVHPDDPRYMALVGRTAIVPLIGRKIPIIADKYVEIELGSGALKITPAHDFNDFELGKQHKLRAINIFSPTAQLCLQQNADFLLDLPQSSSLDQLINEFEALDRFKARTRIIALLESNQQLASVQEHRHMVPHGERGGVIIEPFLTDQWYVDAKKLAVAAIKVVKDGDVKFVPESWQKTYFQWMDNIQPWCISRQLWWGHQIPAWYGPDNKIFVEKTAEQAHTAALAHYGKPTMLVRDEDVLDTWFSSALWPFSTLGWPEKSKEMQLYYPTNYLVTGFDLIFFWIARMLMLGVHFTGQVPFKTIYIHALVRDKNGAKMSKSKGNVVNPLDLVDEYGADALRFTLAIMAAQGRDIKLDPSRIAGYRNFVTKLWNATRFAQLQNANFNLADQELLNNNLSNTVNRWVLHELSSTIVLVTEAIANNRFNEAAAEVYKFTWGYFCDWYLELVKPILTSAEESKAKIETQRVIGFCLQQIYKLLHPFMPYITEELWQQTTVLTNTTTKLSPLAVTAWPKMLFVDSSSAEEINFIIDLISEIRSVRAQMHIAPSLLASLLLFKDKDKDQSLIVLNKHESIIKKLARLENISETSERPSSAAQIIINNNIFYIELGSLIDIQSEKQRLAKEAATVSVEIDKLAIKFNNDSFMKKAKPSIIANDKLRMAELVSIKEKLESAIKFL